MSTRGVERSSVLLSNIFSKPTIENRHSKELYVNVLYRNKSHVGQQKDCYYLYLHTTCLCLLLCHLLTYFASVASLMAKPNVHNPNVQ